MVQQRDDYVCAPELTDRAQLYDRIYLRLLRIRCSDTDHVCIRPILEWFILRYIHDANLVSIGTVLERFGMCHNIYNRHGKRPAGMC